MQIRHERTRHAAWLFSFFVELRTMAARRAPIVMASWYIPTIKPRMFLGEHSLWYIGTKQETRPTPRPAMTVGTV